MTANQNNQYKETLNLPKTDFPMKANLPQREPAILAKWDKMNLYQQIRKARVGRPQWILHDGPPYANGRLHIGHAVNKILKDVVVKSYSLSNYDSPYVPGWDCHGLPIEVNVEKKIGRPRTTEEKKRFRQECRAYAAHWLNVQRTEFKRMGVVGDWDNPYITMDFKIEANIIRSLARIYQNNHLYQGYKPVQWCLHCASALAEAEVEYKNKKSVAIDIGFPLVDEAKLAERLNTSLGGEGEVLFVIWTTTPWTIPANRSVTLHPQLSYEIVQTYKEDKPLRLVLAAELVDSLMEKFGLSTGEKLHSIKGEDLEGLELRHPYYDRPSLVTLGDYVTTETGTGLVHSAPAYGLDDFAIGKKYELKLDNPVNDSGYYADDTAKIGGWHIFKNEEGLVALLAESGHLLHQEDYEHQYPHCWRHKTPTIYRATTQWFIGMEGLINQVLEETPKIRWVPEWGQERIEEMMKNRPDWCISRQRHWGVPIPFLVHKKTRHPHPDTPRLLEKIAELIAKEGIEGWHNLEVEDFLGDSEYEKDQHILDVWFDSGTTHFSVLRQRPELHYPTEMYLEGSDQHRGWFQSSILAGVAMDGKAPYKEVLTHGFTVDGEGRKMSKSVGNIVEPQEIISQMGADILRWWVLATDYTSEIAISNDILSSHKDVYRRIRNTARFLLANLHDFDPAKNSVPFARLLSLDRWVIDQALRLQDELKADMTNYLYAHACRKIHNFCVRQLGSFYLDIVKDRQYTAPANSLIRRSAQTAMFHILEALVRWLSPLLSFTAEEIWEHMPGDRSASVFTEVWYEGLVRLDEDASFSHSQWQQIMQVKEEVNRLIEEKRAAREMGSSLEAELVLYCDEALLSLLAKLGEELRFVLITSAADLRRLEKSGAGSAKAVAIDGLEIELRRSSHDKCIRCWHRVAARGKDSTHPQLCGRCITNLTEPGETRLHA